MKEKYVVFVRECILIVVFGISTALSMRLLINTFSDGAWYSNGIYGILALTLQFLQLYSIMLSKTEFKKMEKGSNAKGFGYLMLYFLFTFLSLVASFSFISASIETNSVLSEAANDTFGNYDLRIAQVDSQIESYNTLLSDKITDATELDEMYVTAGAMIVNDNIAPIQAAIDELYVKRDSIIAERNEEATIEIVSTDTFDLFANRLGLRTPGAGEWLSFIFMGLIAIAIELGIAVCSKPVETQVKIHEDKAKVMKYVSALMNVSGTRLNSDKKVSEETGLSLNECKRYKEMLQNSNYKGVALITTVKGGSRANFSKDVMMRIVNMKLSLN